jgi:predicted signal transduction protein with EAL and GGDEF domain
VLWWPGSAVTSSPFLLLHEQGRDDDVVLAARRMLHALEQPIDLDGVNVEVGAAVGLAFAPEHARDAPGLLKRADLAMYEAKAAAAGVRVYEPSMDTTNPNRLAIVGELRQAIDRHELLVHVQPKASLATGEVYAVEALVRWQHPTLGIVAPDSFVPVAERSGLIRPLTMLVLRTSLAACRQWMGRRPGDLRRGEPLAAQPRRPDLVEDVASCCAATASRRGCSPWRSPRAAS